MIFSKSKRNSAKTIQENLEKPQPRQIQSNLIKSWRQSNYLSLSSTVHLFNPTRANRNMSSSVDGLLISKSKLVSSDRAVNKLEKFLTAQLQRVELLNANNLNNNDTDNSSLVNNTNAVRIGDEILHQLSAALASIKQENELSRAASN
jgi:hypothetical protein